MSKRTLRPLWVAAAMGAAAPVATALCIGVAISLSYSTLFFIDHGDPAARLELGRKVAERIQSFAPVLGAVLLFAAAIVVGRRLERSPHASALTVAVCGFVVGTAFAVGFGGELNWTAAIQLAVDLTVAEVGVTIGFDRSRAAMALDRASRAIERARSEGDVATAIHAACRDLGLRRASIYRLEDERLLVRRASAPPAADGEAERVDLFQRADLQETLDRGEPFRPPGHEATLWMPLLREGTPFAALELHAVRRGVLAERREPLWKALATQVALALANLDLLEQVRVAASRRERQQLSADIHDTLAQNLISAVVHLEAAQRKRGDGESIDEHVGEALAAAREGLGHARGLVWSSRGESAREPLDEALARAVTEFEAQSGVTARLCTVGDAVALGSDAERLLLRAAREGLTNARKHAKASQIRVTLTYMEDGAALDIADDGQGFDSDAPPAAGRGLGFGLCALREQAAAMGGSVSIESEPASGTILTLQLPTPSRRAT